MKRLFETLFALSLFCISSECFAASPDGTTVPPATQIVDSSGGVWTVNANGICLLNGVQAGNCNSVQTLLFHQGNIYVGSTFGTWWGWLLGWHATTLIPLPTNQLNDTQATSPTSFFLSSIWMSGYGISGTGTELYFTTGNSDCNWTIPSDPCPASTTYNGTTNIQESVAKLNTSGQFLGIFTPTWVATLDSSDNDLGSGGVLLLPPKSEAFRISL
jgi:hypothetical protein